MAQRIVPIESHVLDVRTGIWCSECGLPAIVEVDVALVNPKTLVIFSRYMSRVCTTERD